MNAPLPTPSTLQLVGAPELAAFAIVDAALTVLARALEAHTLYMLDEDDDEPHPLPATADVIRAGRAVLAEADELRYRMRRYTRAVDRVLGYEPPARWATTAQAEDAVTLQPR